MLSSRRTMLSFSLTPYPSLPLSLSLSLSLPVRVLLPLFRFHCIFLSSLVMRRVFLLLLLLLLVSFHSAASRTYGSTRRDEAGLPSIARAPILRGAAAMPFPSSRSTSSVELPSSGSKLPRSHARVHSPWRDARKISRCERARRVHRRDDDNNSHQAHVHNCSRRIALRNTLLARSLTRVLIASAPSLVSQNYRELSSIKQFPCNSVEPERVRVFAKFERLPIS